MTDFAQELRKVLNFPGTDGFRPRTFTEEIEAAGKDLSRVYSTRGVEFKKSTLCPFHEDGTPSFSIIKEGIAWKCHAGCAEGDIVDFVARVDGVDKEAAIATLRTELEMPRVRPKKGDIVGVYEYGQTRKVKKYVDGIRKTFTWEHRTEADGWRTCGRCEHPKTWYRPVALADPTRTVYVTEGEKAADALTEHGYIATSTGGAESYSDEHTALFPADRNVVILRDNDEPGMRHAVRLASSLAPKSASMKIVCLPGLAPKEDPFDFLERGGLGIDAIAAGAPEFDPTPNLGRLLSDARSMLRDYLVLPTHAEAVLVLWVAHTYVFDLFEVTPYLHLSSPEKRSGKTVTMKLLLRLVPRGVKASSVSEAVLFRIVEDQKPVLFCDEFDETLKRDRKQIAGLLGILNDGADRDGMAMRMEEVRGKQVVKMFSAFCPKAIASIGELSDTLEDRSITIQMKRKPTDARVTSFRIKRVKARAAAIAERFAAWATLAREQIEAAPEPDYGGLTDRALDKAEPLLLIAEIAGGEWPELARNGLKALCAENDPCSTTGNDILTAVVGCFRDKVAGHRISSKDLVEHLNTDEDIAGWNKGFGIRPDQVARFLKPYGIRPRRTENWRGYLKEDVEIGAANYATAKEGSSEPHQTENRNRELGFD